MQAKPDKFKATGQLVENILMTFPLYFKQAVYFISFEDTDKLTGIDIGFKLNFNEQVIKVCGKAAISFKQVS